MIQKCCRCEKSLNLSDLSNVTFNIEFMSTTYSDLFGASGWGFEADNLCLDCGSKLFHELEKFGLKMREIEF